MRNELSAPVTPGASVEQSAGERLFDNPAVLSGKMSRTEITQKVRGMIAARGMAAISEIHDFTSLKTISENAFDACCMVIDISQAFGVSFDGEEFTDKTTVGEIISLIEGAVAA